MDERGVETPASDVAFDDPNKKSLGEPGWYSDERDRVSREIREKAFVLAMQRAGAAGGGYALTEVIEDAEKIETYLRG